MATRLNTLSRELNIGIGTLIEMLNSLGYKENYLTDNSKIPDDIAILMKGLYSEGISLFKFIDIISTLKTIGYIDLDAYNDPKCTISLTTPPLKYSEKQDFWINELAILSPSQNVNYINVGSFDAPEVFPLYSILIGTNGAGKSSLMKELVDFFIDLHAYVNKSEARLSSSNKGRLKGVKYHIDGVECEVIKLGKNYFAKIDGHIRLLKDLRLPTIVACHFGAFEKFPTQKINGSTQTKYDVPYYKYVGAHVNGNLISSSTIAFRLLFALNEQMDNRQRQNICSILDFIGYDHRISLSYSLVMKSKKSGDAREVISQRVEKDREYRNFSKQEKNEKIIQLPQIRNRPHKMTQRSKR